MKIGDIVTVSEDSKSKVAGKKCIIIGFNFSRGLVKVQAFRSSGFVSSFVGYVKERYVTLVPKGWKARPIVPELVHTPVVEEVESHDGYVCESNDIRGVVAQDVETIDQSHVGVDFKWKLGRGVCFNTPKPFKYVDEPFGTYETSSMSGYITDQWVEGGVKLYNIVFLGTFKVVPESFIVEYANIHRA
ncbi:MotB modifier of transcription [Escherichia phage JS10]|uniref:MotB modifier of transcription n=1 Tax=Escherichia phage JS10 TaxID=576790 RepID=C4MZA3_9CAUD|nr:MotB-like transcriptional regulator [Escherichia phage JS10]ACL78234.1 MotB modifier of transcription [Escherichia phage JS10]